MFETAIPVIHVVNSVAAEEFYCKRLGFKLLSSWRPSETAMDPCYMTMSRDAARLHVTSFKDGMVGAWTSTTFIYVDDVDTLHAELLAKGVTVSGPFDQTWGNREIGVRDADRNVITFGQRMPRKIS